MGKGFHPVLLLAAGLVLGGLARLLDLYTTNLGNIFSQMAIWILFGVLIAIHSRTWKQAMAHVLLFCLGMLVTYYGAAALTNGVYSGTYVAGWTMFALCSPLLAYFAWMAKEQGVFPAVIRVGIVAVSAASSVILFDGFRVYDLLIDGALVYFLFFEKVRR